MALHTLAGVSGREVYVWAGPSAITTAYVQNRDLGSLRRKGYMAVCLATESAISATDG